MGYIRSSLGQGRGGDRPQAGGATRPDILHHRRQVSRMSIRVPCDGLPQRRTALLSPPERRSLTGRVLSSVETSAACLVPSRVLPPAGWVTAEGPAGPALGSGRGKRAVWPARAAAGLRRRPLPPPASIPSASNPAAVMWSSTPRPSSWLRQIVFRAKSALRLPSMISSRISPRESSAPTTFTAAPPRSEPGVAGGCRPSARPRRRGWSSCVSESFFIGLVPSSRGRDHPGAATTPSRAARRCAAPVAKGGRVRPASRRGSGSGRPSRSGGEGPRDALVAGSAAGDPPAHPPSNGGIDRGGEQRARCRGCSRPSSAKWRPWRESRKSRTPWARPRSSRRCGGTRSQAPVGSATGLVSMREMVPK